MGKTSLNITQPLISLMLYILPGFAEGQVFSPRVRLPPAYHHFGQALSCKQVGLPQSSWTNTWWIPRIWSLAALFSSPWATGHQPWRVGSAWPWRGSRWRRWSPWMPRQSCGSAPPTCCASPSVSGCLGGLVAVVAEMTIDHQRRGGNDTLLGEKWESGGAWRGDANFKDHFCGALERKSWRFSMPNLHRRPGATGARETWILVRPCTTYCGTGTPEKKEPHCRLFMIIPLLDVTPLSFHCLRWPSAAAKAKGRISLVAKTEWPETRFEVHESPEDLLKILETSRNWEVVLNRSWLDIIDNIIQVITEGTEIEQLLGNVGLFLAFNSVPAWLCGLRWWQEIKVTTSDVSFTFTRATGANSFGTPSQLDSLEPESWIGELLVSNANQQAIGWGSPHPVGQWVTSQPEITNPRALHWASGIQPLRRVALEAASDLGGCRAQLHCHWRHGKSIPPSSPVLAGNKPFWGKEGEGLRNRIFSDMPRNGKNQVSSMCHCQRDRRSMAAAPTRTGWSTTKGSLFCSMLLFRWMN